MTIFPEYLFLPRSNNRLSIVNGYSPRCRILFFLVCGCFLFPRTVFAQYLDGRRSVSFYIFTDTVMIDTLSIVPGSVFLSDESGNPVNDSLYRVDYSNAFLIPRQQLQSQRVTVHYSVFPLLFTGVHYRRDYSTYPFAGEKYYPGDYFFSSVPAARMPENSIIKNGNISRGITIGTNQNASVTSNLNLQLSGRLSDDLNITAVISDNSVPVQPDGYTQQIQEFDKVFIQLYNEKMDLVFGDFELNSPSGYFMQHHKKLLGASGKTWFYSKEKKDTFITSVSLAVSRGKFNRYSFTGIEGSQGPYRLTGAENELFIVILAGSERIYINGELLKRGEDNDYVIDYNTAELTFMPRMPITKDKRIIAEFQYSEQSYARFLMHSANEWRSPEQKIWLNLYTEEDSRNQTLQQDLKPEHIMRMAAIGDSLSRAIVPNIDTVAFEDDQVLYKQQNINIDGIIYRGIFVQSTDPDSAIYRVGFSFVGENNGNYILIRSAANGKVYQWVPPLNGIPQGNYEPARLLVTPKRKQLLTIGTDTRLNHATRCFFEAGVSNNDLNTFSRINNGDNRGAAVNTVLTHTLPAGARSHVVSKASYMFIHKNFEAVERFRSVEFERDWNLAPAISGEEHLAGVQLQIRRDSAQYAGMQTEYYRHNPFYTAIKNSADLKGKIRRIGTDTRGSILDTRDSMNTSRFTRHYSVLSYDFPFITAGITDEMEDNKWRANSSDSLLPNSYFYNQYGVFIRNHDTAENTFFALYKNRQDFQPFRNRMIYGSLGEDYSAGAALMKNRNHTVQSTVTYRRLKLMNDSAQFNTGRKQENSATGKIDHTVRFFSGLLSVNSTYIIGSGFEIKKSISYLEVSPGQGIYTWNDYNSNGLKEVNEFEQSAFKDLANYIRIYTPTNDYIKAFSNQFNQSYTIRPAQLLKRKESFFARFEDRFAYGLIKKNTVDDLGFNMNPFTQKINDTSTLHINSNYRNMLSFNKFNPAWGIDYLFQKGENKLLLVNGFNVNHSLSNELVARIRFFKELVYFNEATVGFRKFTSEFFPAGNYNIAEQKDKNTLKYSPLLVLMITGDYQYKEMRNTGSFEKLFEHSSSMEVKYSFSENGNLLSRVSYLILNYNSAENTPVAYEMLQGLTDGHNILWSMILQKTLTGGLELFLTYEGRKAATMKPVHTGSIQVRANF